MEKRSRIIKKKKGSISKFWFLILIIGVMSTPLLTANIAAPSRIVEGQGDLFDPAGSPLTVEKEELFFDFSEFDGKSTTPSPCLARYFIFNPTEERVEQRLYFLSPSVKDIKVSINGSPIVGEVIPLNPQLTNEFKSVGIETDTRINRAYVFQVECSSGERVEVEVSFSILPGWDLRAVEFGPTAPQAAHLTNSFRSYNAPTWYEYNLNAAKTFSSFGEFQVEVLLPEHKELMANIDFTLEETNEVNSENEKLIRYYAKTRDLPAKNLDLKLLHPENFNSLGGTVGLGMSIGFDGRGAGFLLTGLLDLSLENHMISLGIESHPFRQSLSGILKYTLFPPGRASYSPLSFFDLRAGGNLIYTILPVPEQVFGGRLFVGLRFGIFAFEFGYEHFFIGAVEKKRNGLILLWSVGI